MKIKIIKKEKDFAIVDEDENIIYSNKDYQRCYEAVYNMYNDTSWNLQKIGNDEWTINLIDFEEEL